MNYAQWLQHAEDHLATVCPNPHQEAMWLLEHIAHTTRARVKSDPQHPITASETNSLEKALTRRTTGEPLAYILEEAIFFGLALKVDPSVLVPRLETELLVEWALEQLPTYKRCHVLDLGTGSGAIALAIAHQRPNAVVVACDQSPAALDIAEQNRNTLNLNNVTLALSSWFNALPPCQFDLIVSNPPYIEHGDSDVAPGTLKYEPHQALFADEHGLADLRHIALHSKQWLKPKGQIALEHGYQQAEAVRQLLEQNSFVEISSHRDFNHHERYTVGQVR